MIKKVFKHVFRAIIYISLAVFLTTVVTQLTVYKEKETISVSSLDFVKESDPIYLTAHRGVNALAPENSIPAFKKSTEMGYYAAECDIRLTSDNVWVLNHDDTLFLHFWDVRNISESDYDEIKNITYKNGTNISKYYKETIPTLDEYLELFVNSNTRPQIEIKSGGTENLDSILNSLDKKGLRDKAIIISFDINQLIKIREFDKNIELWYLTEDFNEEKEVQFKKLGENKKLAIKLSEFTDEQINNITSSSIKLAAWTVDENDALMRAYNLGIRYITTNIFSK